MRTFILIALILITGCFSNALVCRHQVGAIALWAEENKLDYKIVVYQVNPLISLGLYNAHAQVRTEKGWINSDIGPTAFFDSSTYQMTGWRGEYDFPEYIRLMKKRCFDNADCKNEGIP